MAVQALLFSSDEAEKETRVAILVSLDINGNFVKNVQRRSR